MKYKIIVDKQSRKNPSAEKREYEIDIEELRYKGNIHDNLIITKDEDYVIRRLSLSKYHVLKVLDEPIKEPLQNINIELFEGDNYIYLVDMTGNKLYAEYLIKNEFNDVYITKSETYSAITETAKEIDLNVSQKLENYSTTEEMNALIQLLSNQINLELSKKVNGETITGAYLLLKINGDTSSAKLSADKIELTANDVLNLLAGNTINLTSKNITISSTNFAVDKAGNITAIGGAIGGFVLGKTEFTGNLNGIYNYNSYDRNACQCMLLDLLGSDTVLKDIFDANSNNAVGSDDLFAIQKILLGQLTNTKNIKGTIKINSGDPKNALVIQKDGVTVVSLGVGGVNTNLVTTKNFVCGGYSNPSSTAYNVITGNGDIAEMNFKNSSNYSKINPNEIITPKLTQTSLKSKKKNIKKLKVNALELIKNADICLYNLKSEKKGSKQHIGLVIDKDKKYNCPTEVISEDGQGVEQYSMTSLAWKAIQELVEENKKLKGRIEKLEAK